VLTGRLDRGQGGVANQDVNPLELMRSRRQADEGLRRSRRSAATIAARLGAEEARAHEELAALVIGFGFGPCSTCRQRLEGRWEGARALQALDAQPEQCRP
jgi:hypothetical protein